MAGTYTFGSFRLDAADARLWRGGGTVPVTLKAFAVLEFLVRHAGRLVTKQELLDAIWPDVHVRTVRNLVAGSGYEFDERSRRLPDESPVFAV